MTDLREAIGAILDEHEDAMIDWCHDQSTRGRPDTDDIARRIVEIVKQTQPPPAR